MGVLMGAGLSLSRIDSDVFEVLASKINRNICHARPLFVINNFDALMEGLTLRLMPTNLLEAMWIQFGQAVESNKTFRQCRHCGVWFDLSPKAARVDKVFCTEACKARAYRRRLAKQETEQLLINEHSDGGT
jgi:hypothetical protein